MRIQKWLLLLILLFCNSISYAGELVAKEGVNYFNAAVEAQKESRYSDAEKNYQKTVLADPANRRWPLLIANNRGVMSMERGDLRTAEKYFLEALQIDPDFMPARINYGFIIDKRGNELESIKYWMKLLNIDLQKLKPKNLILVQEEPVEKEGAAEKAAP